MASFCKYCGKVLQDGEICTCPQAQAEAAQQYQVGGYPQPPQGYQQPPQGYQQPPQGYPQPPQGYPQGYQPQQPAAKNPVGDAFQKLLPYLKSYVTAPVSTAQGLVAQKDVVFAAILLCVQAVAGALLMFSFVGAYLKNIFAVLLVPTFILGRPLLGSSLDSLAGMDSDVGGLLTDFVDISANIPLSLIFGVLAAAVAIGVFILAAFAVGKLSGSDCSIQDAVVACAAHTPLVSALLLLSFLFFLFLMPLGVIFLMLAVLAWTVLAIPTLQSLAPNAAQNKFWLCAMAGVLVTLLVGCFAAHTFSVMAVGKATVKIEKESATIEELRDGLMLEDWAELLADAIEDGMDDLEDELDDIIDDIDFDDLFDMMEYIVKRLS